jgi:hypothetical protein
LHAPLLSDGAERVRPVVATVVREDALDLDADGGERLQRALQEACGAVAALVGERLDVA